MFINNPSGGGSGSISVKDATTTVTNVTTIDFTGATVSNGGGGIADVFISGLTELTATGAVNGSNQVFTFTQQPSYIVSDGAWYKKLDSNGGTNWSWVGGTLTATMTVPPQSAIFGIA